MSLTCSLQNGCFQGKLAGLVTIQELGFLWKELGGVKDVALIDFQDVKSLPDAREIRQFAQTTRPLPTSRLAFVCTSMAVFGAVRALTSQCDWDGAYNVFREAGEATSWLGHS